MSDDEEQIPLDAYGNEPAARGMRPALTNGAHRPAENPKPATDIEPDEIKPLIIEPASTWASQPEPPPRDWLWKDFVPAGRVTSFLGNGGIGKTTIALQMATHIAAGRDLFGYPIAGGPVIGIFCEDEQDEIKRRWRAAATGENLDLESFDNLFLLSRDGEDNLLCTFDHDHIQLTRFYRELEATVAEIRPRGLFVDTAADVFAGDFMSTTHVRQFIKVCLGRLCVRYGCAVILLAHPSQSAMNSGDGGGFSTAWNNSVRSRLYLRRPQSEDKDAVKDKRILAVKKANYGPDDFGVPLTYRHGCFVPDDSPIEEGQKPVKVAKATTRLAYGALTLMREIGKGGIVVTFGALFEPLQKSGEIAQGDYQTVRKPLQRVLKQFEDEGLIKQSKVPKGYRLASESS